MLLLLCLVFIPPLLNVSRFQRRITSNLSGALGRPVHLDRVRLSLLPLPGFTLENFVVDEDPAFGYEPILRASQVRATVRLSSLWSHHVEFSRISLSETTSVNLVRLPNGHWNFEPVLLQASRLEAAPTAQPFPGPAPRFPYIEASGARLNLKFGEEKMPVALTDSDFALWLPGPREWHFRLEAHPARTDVAPADIGLLRVEGILGGSHTQAASLAEVPMDLHADWQAAPLAGLSRLLLGRDAGLRGSLTLSVHTTGTPARSSVTADVKLAQVRRADFIPAHLVALQAACQATATASFQSFSQIVCRWPPEASPEGSVLTASGAIPDLRDPPSAWLDLTAKA
ncbi:MAG: AsmA family protein, partial [Acidobacteriota bacterium]|nr:AsmA family protein [Acidobacteriota bacterium]